MTAIFLTITEIMAIFEAINGSDEDSGLVQCDAVSISK